MTIILLALSVAGCFGDPAPTAEVGGRAYGVAVARGLVVANDDLIPYGRIDRASDPSEFLDDQVFAIRGVDPSAFLLVHTKPGAHDDAGPWGDFLLLAGGAHDTPICAYFTRLGPTWCE